MCGTKLICMLLASRLLSRLALACDTAWSSWRCPRVQVLQAVAPAGDARVAPKLAVEQEPPGGATALMARLQAEAARPFDLFNDHSLMRALVLQSGPEESTVLVCVHHAGARLVTPACSPWPAWPALQPCWPNTFCFDCLATLLICVGSMLIMTACGLRSV